MRVRHVLAAAAVGLVLTGCAVEVDGNEAGLECADGNPVGNVCPLPNDPTGSHIANRQRNRRKPSMLGSGRDAVKSRHELQKDLDRAVCNVAMADNYPGNDFMCDRPISTGRHGVKRCVDVTSIDNNWDNDVLCTRPDGSQFYTSYEGADAYLGQ